MLAFAGESVDARHLGGLAELSPARTAAAPACSERENGFVLKLYLDQNKWIDLARAETGHPGGEAFVEALAVFKKAVDEGRACFALSAAHYYETGKQRDRKRRTELATTMVRLAGTLRIAPPHTIVPWEIQRALVEVFDLPLSVPDIELFGHGVAHAFSAPTLRYTAPTEWHGVPLPTEWQQELQRRAAQAFEAMILASVTPEGMPDEMRLTMHDFKNLTDDRFVQGQEEVAAVVKQHGRRRLEDIMLATAYTDIRMPVAEASYRLGLEPEQVGDNWRQILEAIPSRWVEMKLRHQRQANPQKAWHGNDLNDVTALAIAVPYCDVVVTEKSWVSLLNAAKVGDRFGHHVTRSLQDVAERLA